MSDFLQEELSCSRAMTRRYVEGTNVILDKLGHEHFYICLGKADAATAKNQITADGWRYKVMPDGTLYCPSMAIEDVAIGIGLPKCVPWLKNKFNPSYQIMAEYVGKHCRIMAILPKNKMKIKNPYVNLLKLSGDVEENPGPVVVFGITYMMMLCCKAIAVIYVISFLMSHTNEAGWLSFKSISTFTSKFIRQMITPFTAWLDHQSQRCAYEEVERANWLWWYSIPIMSQILHGASYLGWVPRYQDVSVKSFICSFVHKFREAPVVVKPLSVTTYFYTSTVSIMGIFVVAFITAFYLATRRPRYITVVNDQRPFALSDLRNDFKAFQNSYGDVKHVDGAHPILAAQRWKCEKFAFDTLLTKFKRVRDVGGSRKRFTELGNAKHICCPTLSNIDIMRNDTDNYQFDNCSKRGEECPLRHDITAAVLSHVDYHCTSDQLTRIVTGPTFIINHDFNVFSHGVGKYTEINKKGDTITNYEALVHVENGLVSMTPDGGTPYTKHPFHHWQNEGTVVSATGAFTYSRLGNYGETSVYYCHPSEGVYNVEDDSVLHTSTKETIPMLLGCEVTKTADGKFYRAYHHPSNKTVKMDGDLVSECVFTMASANRNAKYYDVLRSFVSGKMKSYDEEMFKLEYYLALIAYLADVKACDTVYISSIIVGNPTEFTWKHYFINKTLLILNYSTGQFLRRCVSALCSSKNAKFYAPWIFRTIRVPSYEVYSKMRRSTYGSGIKAKYNKQFFLDEPATSVPIVSEPVECSAVPDDTKYCDIPRKSSLESVTHPVTAIDEVQSAPFGLCNNAQHVVVPTPPVDRAITPDVGPANDRVHYPGIDTPEEESEDDGSNHSGEEGSDISVGGATNIGVHGNFCDFATLTFDSPRTPMLVPSMRTNNKNEHFTVWVADGIDGPKIDIPIPKNLEDTYDAEGVYESTILQFVENILREARIYKPDDVRAAVLWCYACPILAKTAVSFSFGGFKPERYDVLYGVVGTVVPATHKTISILGMGISVPIKPAERT